jgi:hypothetical protein
VLRIWPRLEVVHFHQDGLGWPRFERCGESAVHDKKTLVSSQNLENKRPYFFRPARSMVLKVVRGKILETLELACFHAARRCALPSNVRGATGRAQRLSGPGAAPAVRLSKIDDYLADNFCVPMLSEVVG